LAMLNPGPVCASAHAARKVSSKVDRTLKFYYPHPPGTASR
jgi:hypothetical protein